MRVYIEVARCAFQQHLAYRTATLAGLVTNAFWGALRSFLFLGLFQGREMAAGWSVRDAIDYVWITQALIMPVHFRNWREIANTIRTGDVVSDLAKPVAKQRVRDFLLHMNRERGLTVLLTTHDMADIAHLCQRMMLIDRGQLLYNGAVAAIRERFGVERTLVVDLAEDEQVDGPLTITSAEQVRADGPRRWLRFRREEITAAELIAAVSARYRIRDLTIEEPEIESIVRRIYEEGL